MNTKTNQNGNHLPMPKNQVQEILYELLCNPQITRQAIMRSCGCLNLTARIADIRALNIAVKCVKREASNKFGRAISYGMWTIQNKKAAKAVYLQLQKTSEV